MFGLWFLFFGFLIFSKLTSCAWVLISMFFRVGFLCSSRVCVNLHFPVFALVHAL